MILTSFLTTFLAFSFFKSRLDIDLHASDRPEDFSVTANTAPNCPRPSSSPKSNTSFTSGVSFSSTRPLDAALLGADVGAFFFAPKTPIRVVRRPFSRRPGVSAGDRGRDARAKIIEYVLKEFARVRFPRRVDE